MADVVYSLVRSMLLVIRGDQLTHSQAKQSARLLRSYLDPCRSSFLGYLMMRPKSLLQTSLVYSKKTSVVLRVARMVFSLSSRRQPLPAPALPKYIGLD